LFLNIFNNDDLDQIAAMLNKLRGDYTKWFGALEALRAATIAP
jgi:hypothetical protein